MRPPEMPWPDRFERNVRIIELYIQDKTLREIGRETDLSHPCVIQVLSAVGLRADDRDYGKAREVLMRFTVLCERMKKAMKQAAR